MTDDEPDEFAIFRRHAENKARRHGRLLIALGVVAAEAEPDDPRREDEREPDEPGG
jgi:hypothetical protein